jgi:hypothetical protein
MNKMVPIINRVNGEDQTVGMARVLPDGEDVEYYLKPGFGMAEAVMREMTKQLKKLARR